MTSEKFLYKVLDIQITLRCNAKCSNCIRMCNTESKTGLIYSDSDMTIEQIDNFIKQIKSLNKINVVEIITITGGEPLLHPDIEIIVQKIEELQRLKICDSIRINSNTLITAPVNIKKYIINHSLPKDNRNLHNTILVHPTEFGGSIKKTYDSCTHFRKNLLSLNYLGYTVCCAGDAYIRLFGMDNLIIEEFPKSLDDFPLKDMDKICEHCPFGHDTIQPFEKDVGCPVSDIYKNEADKNKLGRKITKRFGKL